MRIAIAGAAGRMGRSLVEGILRSSDLQLAAALEASGHPQLGKDAGDALGTPCGVKIGADVSAAIA
ncbi:MAG TPA: 4-hydroxy-tetrahydrodipicolinate reductase, partial [Burkholderiales bacterium]|nr:4-hydroxy-tetrahydrodipicolinate reductase [Burkholderiales bacterium]